MGVPMPGTMAMSSVQEMSACVDSKVGWLGLSTGFQNRKLSSRTLLNRTMPQNERWHPIVLLPYPSLLQWSAF